MGCLFLFGFNRFVVDDSSLDFRRCEEISNESRRYVIYTL